MTIIADLHIHSRFSRACSKDLTIPNLVKWARVKGIDLLGTGDFTHPVWFSELSKLEEKDGILWYEDEKGEFPFLLSSEISLMYSDDGKGRKVHLVYLAPSLDVVKKINAYLDTKGRRDYDGRPIFGIKCRDFAEAMEKIDKNIEIIPAHIWTPWFGIFGSKGGYNTLKDSFKDKLHLIHAIETGISSDPDMNWKIKDLEGISIVSFSDSHSFWPWRLGREATIFNGEDITYKNILKQIRNNSFKATIETDPAYGMYHFDGHRNCDFSCSPKETLKLNKICPKCKKQLTVGVDFRVEELSGNADHKNKKQYYTLLPLHEVIALGLGCGVNTKKTWAVYDKLIDSFNDEFNVLLNVGEAELSKVLDSALIVELIIRNRKGEIKVNPGYDGVYGKPLLN